jgi:hypothetical protein
MDAVQGGSAGITSCIERSEKRLYTKTLLRLTTYLDGSIYTFFIGVPEIVFFPAEVTLPQVPISEVSAFISAYSLIKSSDA